ncbi:uncharacterized protein OCT59_001265 [Rhizophagus irregularis]|uniref:Uncharacterized protein n=1 Tax=Rhizophagus irregularis (strain DAOM 181602 / DAOM 197198 / MUCL 43194) TaxID=747089 RepID=A0A2H5SHI6_RHIID|nr:hypothetical protein GLOIN_2v1481084 [Rhizophagus irregularis DAOM 181602=DAOM 197198]POG68075.1 hypothetical protein GLOIN_2v1481084 [Rhizophagus irregularis DAOM 181602=DAOM 197198]UZO00010.1 hypothetical protein OCT59_001265 [Rhizophagus irregularis]GBC29809.1 hypothetical protein GLOIN_2v1481084 [Rhizophagus irregularis DAOM 181602=DAOM 197198]|eukprot:XP_025174941.1 hypothetical protein GLOIN_2v1481084 [Rhizophagus irregularis DAOM 181602=DAOM 197198]
MAQLVPDVLLLIFTELKDDPVSLRSCLLVNKEWFNIATPILWRHISYAYDNPFLYNPESRSKLYNVIAHFLPNDPVDPLPQNNIILPLNKLSRMPTFDYMRFFIRITPFWIIDMAHLLIKNHKNHSHKKQILEREIYKLIFSKCINVKHFSWEVEKNLCEYPNAQSFFSNLHSLEINWKFITNQNFSDLSKICLNISKLVISNCGRDKDKKSLIKFIKNQNKLQSLFLDFNNNVKDTCTLLSNVIREKGSTLKNITLQPTLNCVSPIFIQSLENILEITLNNKLNKYIDWQEWEKCLNNIKKFPHLTRLQTSCLPFNIESLIIEKSGGKILEIDSRQSLKFLDYTTENKNLIITISKNCPLLTRLTIDVDHKNLDELSMMFSNCKQLEEIYFTTPVKVLPTGNDLLKVINNSPLNKLRNISFSDKWNFSIEGVENFLKDWKSKNRLPIKFTPHYHSERNFYWTAEHDRLVERYQY